MRIVLGSASKGRREVLDEMGIDFDVVTSDIDEKSIRDPDAHALTLKLAHAKADAVLPKLRENAFLITSDQVVVHEGQILEKSASIEEAKEMLAGYSNSSVEVVDGVVVVNTATGKRAEGVDISRLYFSNIPKEGIEQIVSHPDILTWAGAFGIQYEIRNFIKEIEGEMESIIGLPKKMTLQLLDEVGYGKN